MADILDRILARKREEVEAARAAVPLAQMQASAAAERNNFEISFIVIWPPIREECKSRRKCAR